jgi:hypothetical protein
LVLQDYFLNERVKLPLVPGYVEDELAWTSLRRLYMRFVCVRSFRLRLFSGRCCWRYCWIRILLLVNISLYSWGYSYPVQSARSANHISAAWCSVQHYELSYQTHYYDNCVCGHIYHYSYGYDILDEAYSLAVKPIYGPLTFVDYQSYLISLGCLLIALLIHFLARLAFRKWKLNRLKEKDELALSLLGHGTRLSQISDPSG